MGAVVYSLANGKLYKHSVTEIRPYKYKDDNVDVPLALAYYKKPHHNQFAMVTAQPGRVRVRSKSNATVWFEEDTEDLDITARAELSRAIRRFGNQEYSDAVLEAKKRRFEMDAMADDILGMEITCTDKRKARS